MISLVVAAHPQKRHPHNVMPKRKRKQKIYLGEYRAPENIELASVELLVDEGAMIAGAAVRIAVKNRLILRILRERDDYDQAWLGGAVRDELHALAKEKTSDAKRLTKVIDRARDLPGEAEHNLDYRSGDVENLERRHEMLLGLVERLTSLSADDDYVDGLATAVRDQAWEEIAAAITVRAVNNVGSLDELTDGDRDLRKQQVAADLRKLARSLR